MNNIEMLLDYLRKEAKEDYVSSKVLAEAIGVSDRSIRNYVKRINEESPNKIESNHLGYRLNENNRLNKNDIDTTNQTEVRRFHILRTLIKSSERGLDLFDLADELYVSDATIRADIANLNKIVEPHCLQIVQHHYKYYLSGEEKSMRKLMMSLINYTKPSKTSLEAEVQLFLGDIPLYSLMKMCKQVFEKYQIYPNTYFLKNFLLHLAIAIDRARDNEQLTSPSGGQNHLKLDVVKEISKNLYQLFEVQLSGADEDELSILFNGEINVDPSFTAHYVTNEVTRALEHALVEISDVYMINFNDDLFKNRLLIHVQNLYNRSLNHRYTRNVSILNIRVKYPIVFDIAVYLASVLSHDLRIDINDDEIGFFALHIGSFLNHQTDEDDKIKTIIVTPDYLYQQDEIKNNIIDVFGEDLDVIDVVEDIGDVSSFMPIDFIITTGEGLQDEALLTTLGIEKVIVHEFIKKRDITLIRKKIEAIKHIKYVNYIKKVIPQLIKNEFYISLNNVTSKRDVMEEVSNVFLEQNYVNHDYLEKLKERESISSTSYPSGVAIPHTMKYEGRKTGMIVIQPSMPIDWENNIVKIVIGIAVNKEDTDTFNQIFPRMIELLAESYHVNYLSKSTNREMFIERLIELMSEGDYFPE
jgi:lichenan operon transcriptional antiterminator